MSAQRNKTEDDITAEVLERFAQTSDPRLREIMLGLIKHLLITDLRHLAGNKEVSETVRKLALKMFKQKLESGSKRS